MPFLNATHFCPNVIYLDQCVAKNINCHRESIRSHLVLLKCQIALTLRKQSSFILTANNLCHLLVLIYVHIEFLHIYNKTIEF